MSSIQVRVDGETAKLLRRMRGLANIDTEGVNNAIAEALRTSTVERFKTSRGSDGKAWKSSVRAMQDGKKTLVQKGRLKNSIRAHADGTGLAVGTNDIRAATHQFGDKRTIRSRKARALRFQIDGSWTMVKKVQITIPARPFLGIDEEDMEEIKAMLEDLYEE